MEKVIYSGFDTLDLAIKGAFPNDILKELQEAREQADIFEKDQPIKLGNSEKSFLIIPSGQRGGFKFVLTDGPTGAIYAIKANSNLDEWNMFISVRSNRLLTYGYEKTKIWIFQNLKMMGFQTVDYSINRMDFAIDIQTDNFELKHEQLITPARAKVSLHWSDKIENGNHRDRNRSVVRGGKFETIMVGKMPNREVIIYDKRRAAIDQKHPWWFDAWGIDRDDPSIQIWRVEIRAGRDALAKKILKRTFEACEAELPSILKEALVDVRYVLKRDSSNVSRSQTHPLWKVVQDHASKILDAKEAPVLPSRVIKLMREQRRDMAIMQSFGNLMNAAILDGMNADEIAEDLPAIASRYSKAYRANLGSDVLAKKASEIDERLSFLRGG